MDLTPDHPLLLQAVERARLVEDFGRRRSPAGMLAHHFCLLTDLVTC